MHISYGFYIAHNGTALDRLLTGAYRTKHMGEEANRTLVHRVHVQIYDMHMQLLAVQ